MEVEEVVVTDVTASVAPGSVVMWAGAANPPSGWLICDGRKYPRGQYPDLYSAIGDTFTPSGTSSTDFCVPDLRGLFVRGVDDTGQVDPDYKTRTSPVDASTASSGVGSLQEDEFKAHHHTYARLLERGDIAGGSYWKNGDANTSSTGGSETRPKNMYLYYIIKAL